ncbi:MAG: hypothetical protein D6768_02830 [Chloroflexi bacterium]|nr:MAG: hypothetical protein D6768_02830 [Chloroflexota bacterium]
MMNFDHLIAVGAILFFASVLQGAVGFAFTLFALPFLILTGLELTQAVALISVSVLVQVAVGAYQLRKSIAWREVLPATLIRYVTIPVGVLLLLALNSLDKSQIKQVLGLLILAVLLAQVLWKVEPKGDLHPGWKWLAFSSSGILLGLAAMGGPPVVMWVMAQRWSSRQSRAFLMALFLLGVPLQTVLLYYSSPQVIGAALLAGLAFAPVVALGSTAGVRLGNHINKLRLRQAAFTILFITAGAAVVSPLVG